VHGAADVWTRSVQPHMAARFAAAPLGLAFPLRRPGGLAVAPTTSASAARDLVAFLRVFRLPRRG
jgi:hypothetical protein